MSSSAHSQAAKKHQQDSKTRAHKAVEELKKILQEIAVFNEQIEGVLYGNSYVISTKDKDEGAKWQQKQKHLSAIELSQRTKLVSVDEELFKLVCEVYTNGSNPFIFQFFAAHHGGVYVAFIQESFGKFSR